MIQDTPWSSDNKSHPFSQSVKLQFYRLPAINRNYDCRIFTLEGVYLFTYLNNQFPCWCKNQHLWRFCSGCYLFEQRQPKSCCFTCSCLCLRNNIPLTL